MTKRRLPVPLLWNTRDEFIAPFSSLFDELINSNFPELKSEFKVNVVQGSFPKVDIIDYESNVEILAEIAGWNKEDISIEINEGILMICGKSTQQTNSDGNYLVKELKRSNFQRSFKLNDNLDETKISAEFQNGILKLSIPKKKAEQTPQKITVEIK